MKPRSIGLENFGSYANHTIDLTPFIDHGLFLIHGDTGAGKSTVLDAISWALYARGLANRSTDELLRSRSAMPDEPTRVTLEFSLGEQVFRVRRTMEYERAGKRRTAVTKQRAEALLECLSGNDTFETVTSPMKVNAAIESLLKLSYEQFTKVVVVPQGEFRELLLAKADEREKLLEKIFGTERFARIEEELRGLFKQAAITHDGFLSRRQALFETAGVADITEFDSRFENAKEKLATARNDCDKRVSELDAIEAERDQVRAACERNRRRAQARLVIARFSETSTFDQDRARLVLAERATSLVSPRLERDRADERAQQTELMAEKRRATAQAAVARRESFEPTRESELAVICEEKSKKLSAIERAVETQRQCRAVAEKARVARGAEREAELDRVRAQALVSEINGVVESLRVRHRALRATALDQTAASLAAKNIEERLAAIEERERESAELRAARRVAKTNELECSEARERLAALRTEVAEVIRDHRRALAVELAAELCEGTPCVVCGSETHPAPAVFDTGEQAVGDDAVRRALVAREDEAKAVLARAETSALEAMAEVKVLEARMLAQPHDDAVTRGELERQLAQARARSDGARAAASDEEHTLREMERERERLASAVSTVERATVERDAHAARAEELELEAKAWRSALGEYEEVSVESLEAALEAVRASVAVRREELEHWRRDRAEAEVAARSALAESEVAHENAERESREALRVRENFDAAVRESGFETDHEALAATIETPALRSLAEAIRSAERELGVAQENLKSLGDDEALGETTREAALDVRAEAAREALAEAQARVGAEEERYLQLERLAGQIGAEAQALEKAQKRLATAKAVSELVSGKNDRQTRMSRWVLFESFEQVVACASARLETMSDGRFRLYRRESQQRGGEFGLSVDDAYTGTASRPVATLSGGEMFQASLAMALGLGDVLQAWSGGVRVESLFVDEGFGTLDDEALDKAVSVLERLPEASRMVGVVSHVGELRKRIPARLEVVRGEHGSVAKPSVKSRRT